MIKQELIEQINELRTCKGWNDKLPDVTDMVSREDVLNLVEQLSEPKKVVIPKSVAEWIEHKKFERRTISNFFSTITFPADVHCWYCEDKESRKEILYRAWLDGYEVEKEKLYTVELPNPNRKGKNRIFLQKVSGTDKVLLCKGNFNRQRNKTLWLTESEIKKDFEWAWNAGFAKEAAE